VTQTPTPTPPLPDFNFIATQVTDIVATVLVFVGVLIVARWVFRSPIAEAIGERIRRGRRGGGGALPEEQEDRLARLEGDLGALHGQLTEVQERLDFAERLLAERRRDQLGGR
jgi:hypothetical protein